MLRLILRASVLGLLAAALAGLPLQASAQTATNKPASTKAPAAAKKAQSLPFQGKIAAVDKVAKTITVGKRVFQVSSETRIFKADRTTPAVFDDLIVDHEVTGSCTQADDEKWTAKSIYLKAAPDTKAAPSTAPKSAPASKSK